MGRPKKKPEYDPKKIMNELLNTVIEAYDRSFEIDPLRGELKSVASELEMTPIKVRKLLITAGLRDGEEYYANDRSKRILELYRNGKAVDEIMRETGLNRASVCGYLPYSKGVYKAKELSLVAERIQKYRYRQALCETFPLQISGLSIDQTYEYLWKTLKELEGCIFRTVGRGHTDGKQYKYAIKGGEMFVSRKNKSITKSTVELAFEKAREIQRDKGYISGPRQLGTFGASYLYPIFLRLGVCTQAAEAARD